MGPGSLIETSALTTFSQKVYLMLYIRFWLKSFKKPDSKLTYVSRHQKQTNFYEIEYFKKLKSK